MFAKKKMVWGPLAALCHVTALWAADPRDALTTRLQASGAQIATSTDGRLRFIGTQPSGAIPLISTLPVGATSETIARTALAEYGTQFGILDPVRELTTTRVLEQGVRSTTRFQQTYAGLPVIGGELLVNTRDATGRDSFDNAGATLISVAHYANVNKCPNAWWNGSQVTYCESLPVADDVVAHEWTHAVTQHTSGLYYYYQSGAINESFSDMWGEFIDLTNGKGTDTTAVRWLIGEDVPTSVFPEALRNMKDPALDYGSPDPDRMTSPHYYTGDGDSGGVHHNSGVNNKAVYLMTDGDTFNDRTVTGIGIDKVAAIYYEVQTRLLPSGADYADLYEALQQGCADLVGTHGITRSDCEQVKLAAEAVEMNLPPAGNFTPEATECPRGEAKSIVVFADDMEANTDYWRKSGNSIWAYAGDYNHSGVRAMHGTAGKTVTDGSMVMANSVLIPANGYLWFSHAYEFDGSTTHYDGGVLEYSSDGGGTWRDTGALFKLGDTYSGVIHSGGGNPLSGRPAFVGRSHGYVSTRIQLSSLAGQSVKFRWRLATDGSTATKGWHVDDVSIHSCVPVNATPLAVADSYSTVTNQTLTATTSVLANDTDAESDPLTAHVVTAPSHGTLHLNQNGTFDYIPETGYTGQDSFTYWADDGHGGSSATVTVTVKNQSGGNGGSDTHADNGSLSENADGSGGGAGALEWLTLLAGGVLHFRRRRAP